MNSQGYISWLICRHHGPENHPVSGICLIYRCSRIPVNFTAEHFPHPGITGKPVGKPLLPVIVSFFPCVFRFHRIPIMSCCCLDQISLGVQKPDSILDKQYIFPESLGSRRCYHRLLCKRILLFGKILIPLGFCRFYDDCSE